jgi:3-oxoacyl-[acyl-carrier-protein] synthase-1
VNTGAVTRLERVAVSDFTLVSALGHGRAATLEALRAQRSGLALQRFDGASFDAWLGLVACADEVALAPQLADFDCRNNRVAELGLRADDFGPRVRQAAQRWGSERVGVFLGTSTSGILSTEIAYRQRQAHGGALPDTLHYAHTHSTYSAARYVRHALGLQGPACVVSTACSSSAKAFAAAARMLALGVVDAAVVGGVDTLCMTTLYGFRSLELVAPDVCRPWDAQRAGLSLGEAAAFALLERDAPAPMAWLLGSGESSDGHHMSSPHPEGLGAAAAMQAALDSAGLQASAVEYLNLHGTGTPGNDAAEDKAVCRVFGRALPCSSTKGFTGHTLGAAGGVEAAITMLALRHGYLPANLHLRTLDPALGCRVLQLPQEQTLRIAASNSFGFGGSNACLVFGAAHG